MNDADRRSLKHHLAVLSVLAANLEIKHAQRDIAGNYPLDTAAHIRKAQHSIRVVRGIVGEQASRRS